MSPTGPHPEWRHRASILLIAVAFAFGACGSKPAPDATPAAARSEDIRPITATATVDRAKIDVGDTVKYTLTVRAKKGFVPDLPTTLDNIPVFLDLTSWQKSTREDGLTEASRTATVDPGIGPYFVVPSLTVTFTDPDGKKGEVHADEVTVEVKSRLAAGEAIPDIKERVDVIVPAVPPKPASRTWLWIACGAAALMAGAGVTTWLMLRNRRAARVVLRPPWEMALESITRLRAEGLVAQGRVEDFYVKLSGIVRTYIEGRFNLMAPEMTTEEFLATAKDVSALQPGHQRLLREFLTESDLVKFARYSPGEDEAGSAARAAETFVRETTPVSAVSAGTPAAGAHR